MQLCAMNQLIFLLVVISVAFSHAEDDEPFSIGLGVLSPSYSQTVGKENVKVKFNQKEDGEFSFSVGDPKTGNNQYLSFGPSAGQQPQKPAVYEASSRSTGYQAPALAAGYQQPSGYQAPSAYQPSSGYHAPQLAAGYQAPSYGYSGPSSSYNPGPSSAYNPGPSSAYNSGPSSSYNQPSSGYYGSSHGSGFYGGSSAGKPESDSSGILPAGFSYHATEGQSFLRQSGELRKPQGGPIMPAGFSYHATEGQSFLRQGESPNFAIAAEKKQSSSSERGPAEESFYKNFQSSKPQQGRPYLQNGLVGYGPGGPSRKLPIGGYAGAEFQGAHEEHGGHSE